MVVLHSWSIFLVSLRLLILLLLPDSHSQLLERANSSSDLKATLHSMRLWLNLLLPDFHLHLSDSDQNATLHPMRLWCCFKPIPWLFSFRIPVVVPILSYLCTWYWIPFNCIFMLTPLIEVISTLTIVNDNTTFFFILQFSPLSFSPSLLPDYIYICIC